MYSKKIVQDIHCDLGSHGSGSIGTVLDVCRKAEHIGFCLKEPDKPAVDIPVPVRAGSGLAVKLSGGSIGDKHCVPDCLYILCAETPSVLKQICEQFCLLNRGDLKRRFCPVAADPAGQIAVSVGDPAVIGREGGISHLSVQLLEIPVHRVLHGCRQCLVLVPGIKEIFCAVPGTGGRIR